MAEDVQREVIAEMIEDAKPATSALDGTNVSFLGLKYFHGYCVVSQPSGSGVHIVYH